MGYIETYRGFSKKSQQITVNDEYMIQNINKNPQMQNHMASNHLHLKPVQTSVMKNSQFVIKPSLVSDSVKSKIVFNAKSPENKNPLKVVTFNHKYDPAFGKVSKSLERPQSFNDPTQNEFPRNVAINHSPRPTMIVRPHSSMPQFIPANPQVQIRF
jgi:hypothetical protein